MERTAALTDAVWDAHRTAVFGAAYRILGTVSDAEDVVQDVWVRAAAADLADVRDLRAWLVTLAARTSYNVLGSARVRRETYIGPWLPEPLPTGPDAADQVLLDESVGTAMLVVMEALAPAERVALILHDVFDFPFDRIAEVLGRTPAASRKLASRARARVAAAEVPPQAARAEAERVLRAFKAAVEAGDLAGLVALLHPEAVYVGDGGGKAVAARRPVRGAARIAGLLLGSLRFGHSVTCRLVDVNGAPAMATWRDGRLVWLDTVEIVRGRVTTFRRLANPEKLASLGHI
ncbi:RNA polymerase sigma factor SigJ [Yinghuangia sp. YIM S09857]|uniref:RNA polymerase sigma factor SigJ n=1 Tax=Yinghuangia sp. YIM S09857 TaxID=3436929 RepID=UPI003F53C411